jgi:hypothetical protein
VRGTNVYRSSGVETGGGGGARGPSPPPPVFRRHKKCPFFLWQSALCLREKCCSDCIFDTWMLQSNIRISKFALFSFAKTTANCFNSFGHCHLISSVGRLQRPFIYDCIYFSFPPPPPRQHFHEKVFRCPFHSKSATRNRCPPTF